MQITYLPGAINDINRLYNFLVHSEASLTTADRAIAVIRSGVSSLKVFPEKGADLESLGRRQLVIPFGKNNYLVRYAVSYPREEILILRIWHSREDNRKDSRKER